MCTKNKTELECTNRTYPPMIKTLFPFLAKSLIFKSFIGRLCKKKPMISINFADICHMYWYIFFMSKYKENYPT